MRTEDGEVHHLSEGAAVVLDQRPSMTPRAERLNAADSRIRRALDSMHAEPARRWTVAKLAKIAGMSRPVFARQFVKDVGRSPLRYLACHRMTLAAGLLLDSDASLAEVATSVGYDSEFAFSRAFKRHHHVAPGVFRRTRTPITGSTVLRMAA